jgi:hypothetical protein
LAAGLPADGFDLRQRQFPCQIDPTRPQPDVFKGGLGTGGVGLSADVQGGVQFGISQGRQYSQIGNDKSIRPQSCSALNLLDIFVLGLSIHFLT